MCGERCWWACVVVRGGKPQGERQAAHPSVADISHQSHHTARLNPDASTTTTTRKTSPSTVKHPGWTVPSGGPSPTPLAASDLVNSIQNAIMLQRLLVCTAPMQPSLVHPRRWKPCGIDVNVSRPYIKKHNAANSAITTRGTMKMIYKPTSLHGCKPRLLPRSEVQGLCGH